MSCRTGKLFMNVKMHGRMKEFERKELHKRSPHRQQRSRGMVFQKNTCRILTHLRSCTVMFSSLAWILILWQWRQYYQGQVGVRVCLRLGTCYILVLMELQHICRMGTQGDKSLLDAWAEMR